MEEIEIEEERTIAESKTEMEAIEEPATETSFDPLQNERKFVRMPKHEKKLLRAERMKERHKVKAKAYKERKKERILSAIAANPDNKAALTASLTYRCTERLTNALSHGLNVCVDLSYEGIHNERELSSLSKQLALGYGFLKKQTNPLHLHLCGISNTSSVYEKLKHQGFEHWIVSRHTQLPWEVFPPSNIVLLSPDAPEVLESIEQDKIYVIGGIVDRSVKKSETLSKAAEFNLVAKRLPVQECIPNRLSHVLNIDHMIEILNRYQDNKNWEEVLTAVVPLRKQRKESKSPEEPNNVHTDTTIDS